MRQQIAELCSIPEPLAAGLVTTLPSLLRELYDNHCLEDVAALSSQLLHSSQIGDCHQSMTSAAALRWDAGSCVLITYADTVVAEGRPGLQVLQQLLERHFSGLSSVVHVLPFLQATSDGGFAVASHDALEERFGDWKDLAALARGRQLMADLVLNHVSASHPWVRAFQRGDGPESRCVLAAAPGSCWEQVVRPRSSALFTTLATARGPETVWTTFGPDQVDVNWREPEVLLGFTRLLDRLCAHGVRWLRLDAVGFVWKEPFTECIHRPQAHRLVELLRQLLEARCPNGVVVTETNVPEEENLSYLRQGSEAHLAYNFPLPPLLLEACLSHRADLLNRWLARWPQLPPHTGLLNFSACHDGVGLRPLEGLMAEDRLLQLLRHCEQRGGLVSHRRLADGREVPYEINISWWSAMEDSGRDPAHLQRARFLLSQLLVLALPGVPAFYLPALLASPNDNARFRCSGHRRDLNRPQFQADRLERLLMDPYSEARLVLATLRQAMAIRRQQPALAPSVPMTVLSQERSDLVIVQRGEGDDALLAVHNFSGARISLPLSLLPLQMSPQTPVALPWHDLLADGALVQNQQALDLEPFAVHWLIRR
jgi:sucrose phosphorylase